MLLTSDIDEKAVEEKLSEGQQARKWQSWDLNFISSDPTSDALSSISCHFHSCNTEHGDIMGKYGILAKAIDHHIEE